MTALYKLTAHPQFVRKVDEDILVNVSDLQDGALAIEYAAWRAGGGVPDPYVPTFDQRLALQRARDTRKPILDALSGIGLAAMFAADATTLQAVITARQGLLDITKDAGVLAATSDDGFDAAVLARYHQLVAGAPAAVVLAFQEAAT